MLELLRLVYRAWKYRLKNDRAEIATLLRSLSRGALALDVGAHKGGYLYWMRWKVGYEGRVVGFEPQPVLAARLHNVISAAGWRSVCVHNVGISSKDAVMDLTVPVTKSGVSPGATLEQGTKGTEPVVTQKIETRRLDTLFPTRHADQRVRLIKCDVEGHELEVFRGAEMLLRREAPDLLFECEVRHQAENGGVDLVFDFLRGLDYEGRFFGPGGKLLPLAQFDPGVHQDPEGSTYCNNFFFTRPNRA